MESGVDNFFDKYQLWLSILAFIVFSLGSGVIAGYIAGRLDEMGRYATAMTALGLGSFFLLLLTYTVYLKLFARMPAVWTGPLMWGMYPVLIAAVILGWRVAGKRKSGRFLTSENPKVKSQERRMFDGSPPRSGGKFL
jgi:hypothetical protein